MSKRKVASVAGLLVLMGLAACAPKEPEAAAVPSDAPVAVGEQQAAEMAEPRSDAEMAQVTNEFCPVMTNQKVNPKVKVEHEGQTVYFCCSSCPAKFKADPARYMAALNAQGGEAAGESHDDHAGHDHG